MAAILLHASSVALEQTDMTPSVTPEVSHVQPSSVALERVTGVHVLIADGTPATRDVREQQLLAAGHRVSVARTAFEAIVKATCHIPDVILLDAALSDIETAETVSFLSACPVTAHIPVLRLARGRAVPQRILAELTRKRR